MDKINFEKLSNLVLEISDLDYIKEIERDEQEFILKDNYDGVSNFSKPKVTSRDKMDFIISLKKIQNQFLDESSDQKYLVAFIEAKRNASLGNRDYFIDFIAVATSPLVFMQKYEEYYHSIKNIKKSKERLYLSSHEKIKQKN